MTTTTTTCYNVDIKNREGSKSDEILQELERRTQNSEAWPGGILRQPKGDVLYKLRIAAGRRLARAAFCKKRGEQKMMRLIQEGQAGPFFTWVAGIIVAFILFTFIMALATGAIRSGKMKKKNKKRKRLISKKGL